MISQQTKFFIRGGARMAIHPNELEEQFQEEEIKRRQRSEIWDFMHCDSPKRPHWLQDLEGLMLSDQPGFLEIREMVDQIRWSLTQADPNTQEAVFWVCAWLYPDIRQFLSQTQTPNPESLGHFLHQDLPQLCEAFFRGQQQNLESFVRSIRAEYFAVVGP